MRINPFYLNLVLACVLVHFCNGVPPKPKPFTRITDQEHELIFEMLESQAKTGEYKASVWKDIQTALEEKVKDKVEGFPKCRPIRSLQMHLFRILEENKTEVSEALRELHNQMRRSAVTTQEQDFINRELLQSDDDSKTLFGEKRWIDIQNHHDRKRESGELGFAIQRSWGALRSHFRNRMIPNHLVHPAVKRKFPEYFNLAEGATSFDDMNQSGAGPNKVGFTLYSDQEHELMFKMLEDQAVCYDPTVWEEMEKAFEGKRRARIAGFVTPRNVKSLKTHLKNILKGDKIQVPAAARKVSEQMTRLCITPQEQDLINRELARTDLPNLALTSNARWRKIQEKHEEKRRSGTFGFANRRTMHTLRSHFNSLMKVRDLVSEDVKKRFPQDFGINQGATTFEEEEEQSDNDPEDYMECSGNEEEDIWDPILEDLEKSQKGPVDKYGVDPTMFLEPFDDNDLFRDEPPYDYRSFEPMSP